MNPKNPKKPHVPRELLQWLKERFPDRVPDRNDSDHEVWIKVGNIDVIRHLQSLFDEQEG